MNSSKIGSIEAIAFILIIVANHLILNIPKSLINDCGTATPLNMVYVGILAIILCFFIIKLFQHFQNSDIIDISEYLGGKKLKTIIGIIFLCYFIFTSATLLRNFCEGLKLTYFSEIPIEFLIIAFLLVVAIANHYGFRTIIKSNMIIIPIILLSLLIVFVALSPRFVAQRTLPILGYGVNQTFFTGISNIYAFNGICYLYFIMPMLNQKKDFKKVSYISIAISGVFLVLAISTFLMSFPFLTHIEDLSPMFVAVRSADFGRFFQRPEALFILTWILSLLSYLNIIVMLMTTIFKKITNANNTKITSLLFCGLLFIIAMIPKGLAEIRELENTYYKLLTIAIVFVLSIGLLILANIKHRKKNQITRQVGEVANE